MDIPLTIMIVYVCGERFRGREGGETEIKFIEHLQNYILQTYKSNLYELFVHIDLSNLL